MKVKVLDYKPPPESHASYSRDNGNWLSKYGIRNMGGTSYPNLDVIYQYDHLADLLAISFKEPWSFNGGSMLTDEIIVNTFQDKIVMIEFLYITRRIGCHFYDTPEEVDGYPPFIFQTSYLNDEIEIQFKPRKNPTAFELTPFIEVTLDDGLLQSLRIKNASRIVQMK